MFQNVLLCCGLYQLPPKLIYSHLILLLILPTTLINICIICDDLCRAAKHAVSELARDAALVVTALHYSCTHCINHRELSAHKPRLRTADTAAKLEQTVHYPPPSSQWTGTERQPPPWTDELAEMSRHIYTRHGISDGVQKPIFQVRTREKVITRWESATTHTVLFVFIGSNDFKFIHNTHISF